MDPKKEKEGKDKMDPKKEKEAMEKSERESGLIVLDNPDMIRAYWLLAIKGRLALEMKDIKFRSIPGYGSTHTMVKKIYGYTGSRKSVFEQYCQMLRQIGVLKDGKEGK